MLDQHVGHRCVIGERHRECVGQCDGADLDGWVDRSRAAGREPRRHHGIAGLRRGVGGRHLAGNSASAQGDGVTIDGSTVTITAPGTYRLSGTLADGQVVVDSADDGLVQIILAGVSISSSTTAALAVMDADQVAVILDSGSANTLTDASTYVYPDSSTDEPNAALFSTADLTIGGTGSLAVVGNSNDGIASKDGLVLAGGTIEVTAVDDGLRGKDYLIFDGATVTVDAGGDGVKSDNDTDTTAGYIAVQTGEISIAAGDDGLAAQTDLLVLGGTLSVVAGSPTATDTTSKGLKAETAIAVDAGTISVQATDDSVHSGGSATISDGTLTLAAGDDGVHAEGDLTISGGTVTITTSYEGLESADMTLSGGTIDVTSSDDGINLAGGDGSAAQGPGASNDFGGRSGPGAARAAARADPAGRPWATTTC